MKWYAKLSLVDYTTSIVDETGSPVTDTRFADGTARVICAAHNRALDLMTGQSLGLLADVRQLQAKQADMDFYAEKELKMKTEGR